MKAKSEQFMACLSSYGLQPMIVAQNEVTGHRSGADEHFRPARPWQIILRHLLPSTISYLIVHMTLSIPSMIIGETSLSLLGLGLRPPVVSWGVLMQRAQNVGTANSSVADVAEHVRDRDRSLVQFHGRWPARRRRSLRRASCTTAGGVV